MANAAVISQLRTLEQLTRTEVQIARTRVAQARTDAVRRELRQNGDNAERRAEHIAAALRDLGEVPDVVAPAVGFAAYLVKSTVEQAQPLDEALLGDLALEYQLLDRARFLVALTAQDGPAAVHGLAEQLVTVHTATVDWLTTVLAEEALGGPAALRPTPLQAVAGGVTRAVQLPTRDYDAKGVQDAVAAIRKLRTADGVRAVIRYEEQHKNRSSVVSAAQTHFTSLAKETVGVE